MANKNFYQRKKTINGVEYIAQFNGLSSALTCFDLSQGENGSKVNLTKMAKYLLENVIVQPKGLTIDDFDDIDTYNEVAKFASDVMQGRFREAEDEKSINKESKE